MRLCQLCHGMVEFIDRYDAFAKYLNEHGIYVVGHDHLGHGKSVQNEEYHGYFHKTNGNEYVIGDIHKLREITRKNIRISRILCLGIVWGLS